MAAFEPHAVPLDGPTGQWCRPRMETSGTDGRDKTVGLGLAGLLVAALLLRVYRVGEDSLWFDEILSYRRATTGFGDAYDLMRDGTHPPGFTQVVQRPWLAFGDSEFMVRFPSVVLGTATVGLTYMLGRRVGGRSVGLAGAALLTVLPLHLYYSREGRMYALLAFLVTGWILALSTADRRNDVRSWLLYSLLGAAAMYTHYYAGLTLAATVAVSAWFYLAKGADPERRRRWMIATAGIGVLFVPWLPTFWHQLRDDPVSHLETRPLGEIALVPIQFFTAHAGASSIEIVVVATALVVVIGHGIVHLLEAARPAAQIDLTKAAIVAALLGTLLLALVAEVLRSLISVRYFVGILSFVCIVAAGFESSRRQPAILVASLVLVVVSLVHAVPTVLDTWRPEFEAATDRIESRLESDTTVVLIGPEDARIHATGFDHYPDPAPGAGLVDIDLAEGALQDALSQIDPGSSVVWVMQYATIGPIGVPNGFALASEERYDSRFFSNGRVMSLTRLERVP